jgi:HEAT repeat protein
MSPRMEKAKDFIADEEWRRAIDVLRAAAADPKEKNQDEALFWLAHSQHQAGDLAEAVWTISDLERRFPTSRWVKPARSVRVELAQKLGRSDVLWWTVYAPPPPPPPPPSRAPKAAPPAPARRAMPPPPPPPPMPMMWASEYTAADMDLRIQALRSLIRTDAPRVIPMLRTIALESENPDEASRAVFVLAQSGRPDAFTTLIELAKQAPVEAVSVAAVKELGRFGGPRMSDELLLVYEVGKPRVKMQVVNSLGERSATNALFRIVESEPDVHLKEVAIVTLGRAGGRAQLQRFYRRARPELKRPIIVGLFNARAEDELIEIAEHERDAALKTTVFNSLRLLGTPKSREYLEKTQTSR